jgi:outer membrane protein OmpA-like peptidoglycan-associated protein
LQSNEISKNKSSRLKNLLLEGMNYVTSKGIWSAGIVALGALAAFCIWHHAPVGVPATQAIPKLSNAATTTVASTAAANAVKGVLPPAVTGPTSDVTVNMPSGKSIPVVPKLQAPAIVEKVEPKIEAAKVEPPKVEPPKIEPPTPVVDAPKVEVKPSVVTPKPMAMKVKKKRVMVAKRLNTGCEYKRDSNVVRSICFNFNSDRLSAASKAKLNAIIPTLKDGKQFELNGFADAVGKKTYNSNLSERRNKAVLKYLESKGIDAAKVSVKSFGSEEAEKQKMGKNQRERRVDIRVTP